MRWKMRRWRCDGYDKFQITPGFERLNNGVKSYLLDTNVWSSIASSPKATSNFLPWLEANNTIAAMSIFTEFELSRVSNLHQIVDQLLTIASSRTYIPLLYDKLSDLEMSKYPNDNDVELLWASVTNFKHSAEINFISDISQDSRFVNKREEYLSFGKDKFMKLEDLKENFPLEDKDGNYSEENVDLFAWATTLNFLTRYFPEFLHPFKGNLKAVDTSKLKSLYFRSQFLYFKYYVHKQSPAKSDFLDFANVSYIPYIDTFVTERNILNVLSRMKKLGNKLSVCELVHVRSFVETIESS